MPTLKNPPTRRVETKQSEPLRMSEEQFIAWSSDEVRAEWVDGEVEIMNAVMSDHADLTMFITLVVGNFVTLNELGKVWAEPFHVKLPRQRRRRSPDLFFAAKSHLNLLEQNQFNGAPDLIVEVVSADSQNRDRRIKFLEYQNAGVREYWLADPLSRSFDAYTLGADGKYQAISLMDGKVNSKVLQGFYFRQEWVWQLQFPNPVTVVQQMMRDMKKRSSTKKPRKSDNQP